MVLTRQNLLSCRLLGFYYSDLSWQLVIRMPRRLSPSCLRHLVIFPPYLNSNRLPHTDLCLVWVVSPLYGRVDELMAERRELVNYVVERPYKSYRAQISMRRPVWVLSFPQRPVVTIEIRVGINIGRWGKYTIFCTFAIMWRFLHFAWLLNYIILPEYSDSCNV